MMALFARSWLHALAVTSEANVTRSVSCRSTTCSPYRQQEAYQQSQPGMQ